jgi:hypothetical protein
MDGLYNAWEPASLSDQCGRFVLGFDQSFITFHGVPSARKLSSVAMHDFTLLLGAGVVDLSRPSLAVVGLEGEPDASGFHLVRMVLSPFSRSVQEVGTVPSSACRPTAEDLAPLLGLGWGDRPTLLLPPALLPLEGSGSIYARLLGSLDEGYPLLQAVRRHPADPIGRLRDARPPRNDGRPLAVDEARELADLLLDPVVYDRELTAFIGAWDGSVRKRGWALRLLPFMTMGTEEFCSLLSSFLRSCRNPETLQDR